jgi:hypothetical protein
MCTTEDKKTVFSLLIMHTIKINQEVMIDQWWIEMRNTCLSPRDTDHFMERDYFIFKTKTYKHLAD